MTQHPLTPQSVILFTGGARGITARCAIELAKALPCKMILLGRSRLEPEPDWARSHQEPAALKAAIMEHIKQTGEKPLPAEIERVYRRVSAQREIHDTLKQISSVGAQALYLSADVLDPTALQEALREAETTFGPITALVHGAGVLADKLIENKSPQDFQAVYGTKVQGLKNLLQLLNPHTLSTMVLFSSVAGTFGNLGQADYAMANEFLNKFAHQIKHAYPDCRVLSINWGPWDSGMVTPALKKAFDEMNIPLISLEEGARHFVDELLNENDPPPQIVIGSPIRHPAVRDIPAEPIRLQRAIDLRHNHFLYDHQIGENPVLPATCAAGWMSDACEMSFPGFRFHQLNDFRVLKGVVFEDDTPQTFDVTIKPRHGTDANTLICEVLITSEPNLRRYLAHIVLKQEMPPAPRHPAPPVSDQPIPGRQFYERKTLFHGTAFRGLREIIAINEHELYARCRLNAVPASVQGQFSVSSVNPYMNDTVLQGALVWSDRYEEAPCLPLGVKQFTQYQVLPFDEDCFVHLRIVKHTRRRIEADADVFDGRGNILFACKGVQGTISKSLIPLFQSAKTSEEMQEQHA
ncbi:MAG: SDR family NAD(P)-dependent oxidoreductase [Anaerolineaceae bacterium]|nr:SDR family NAD(P)-dependent oxidoreductase [Anaerolineaceae bacterium]